MEWLLILAAVACPLMMLFMMRGMHGGHSHGGDHQDCHVHKTDDKTDF